MVDDSVSATLEHLRPAEESAGSFHLLLLAPGLPFVHPLPAVGSVTIGRKDAGICIEDRTVSRRHARINLEATPSIEDLGSSNGTFVNGARLVPGTAFPLATGCLIEIGAALLVCQLGSRTAGFLRDPGRREEPLPTTEGDIGAELAPGDRTMRQLHRVIDRIAPSEINVLLTGETGVGKGRLALEIHQRSRRMRGPFLSLNCAAFPETLFESEMFGHEKGAFTGATRMKPGLLENAGGGTVFLDEVGEMPLTIQAKLLHVLEQREVLRLGGLSPRPLDVRFVSATNQDLDALAQSGRFRRDLWFRLNGIAVAVPPLRTRPGELHALATTFVIEASGRSGTPVPTITPETFAALESHDWPGNVRELRNVMERAVVLADEEILPVHLGIEGPNIPSSADLEREEILRALEQCAGNQSRAAKLLGYSRQTLSAKLERHGIPRPRKPVV